MIISQKKLAFKIEEYLLDQDIKSNEIRQKKNLEQGPRFYPSSMSRCCRYLVYDMLGYKKPLKEPKLLRIMENGNSMHDRYQNWFKEIGVLVENESEIKVPELHVSGRIDSIIKLPDIDDYIIVELKSANDGKFNKMVKNNAPHKDYSDQIQLYMELLEMPYGIILVENKNDQEVLEFWIERDIEYGKELIKKIETVNEHVAQKKLPRREHPKYSYECKYCDFFEECWNTDH
jgi:CRISPR/Cas system-associated exonuclease Cas4 (RecB family)